MMMKLTHKYPRGLEPYTAESIKYFVEISDVLLGPGRQNEFIDHCNCINPILRLEERTAGVMIEQARFNIGFLITSMPAAGRNAPVTLDGTIVQATAEIVGGLIIAYLLNPNVDHRGYISSGTMDLKAAVTTQSCPEVVLIDCGVVELMEHAFGGNTMVGGRTYVSARCPGFQAVFEKMLKAAAYQKYTGWLSYGGSGVLDNGSLISPEQLILDLDIQEAFYRLCEIEVKDEAVENIIADVAAAGTGDFLSTDHTLENFRGAFWEPFLFTRGNTRSEQEILDTAHERFLDTVNSYSGYDYEEEKVKAVEEILREAKKELVDKT